MGSTQRPTISLKRAYEPPRRADGRRVLVDRIWPRGVSRDALRLHAWVKDVAPSTALRAWFAHDPARWNPFRRRYFRELDARPEVVKCLVDAFGHAGRVTLVFGARDIEHNNAVALKEYLVKELDSFGDRAGSSRC